MLTNNSSNVEQTYVKNVYEQIAYHFSDTRVYKWSWIISFLDSLNSDSLVYDLGCGNGRNMNHGSLKFIGIDNETKQKIFLKVGRYGRYLETLLDDGKAKRTSIPKKMKNEEIDIDKSIKLLSLPRKIGEHPESKKLITASIGPYGPYLKHDNKYVSLKEDDVTEIGINRAVELIDNNIKSKQDILIGEHPSTKKKIVQKKGIKGRPDYLSYNKKNFSIKDDMKEKKISLEEALKIIDEKISKKKEKRK